MSNHIEPIFNPLYIDANADLNRHQLGSSNSGQRNSNPPIDNEYDKILNLEKPFTKAADLVTLR